MTYPRFYIPLTLPRPNEIIDFPVDAMRHAQVLRLQAGDPVVLFNGEGGEWIADIAYMGRQQTQAQLKRFKDVQRELPVKITLAVGMPANDRMDALIEKATELGASVLQPLMMQRSVLRLEGERAKKKVAHWQGIAIAASEQSGRTIVPQIKPAINLKLWLQTLPPPTAHEQRFVLHPKGNTQLTLCNNNQPAVESLLFLSGPEGGFSEDEIKQANYAHFQCISLGERILRADTAPLAVLATAGWWNP